MPQKQPSNIRRFALSFSFILASAIYATGQQINTSQTRRTPTQELRMANDAFLKTLADIAIQGVSTSTPASLPTVPKPSNVSTTDGLYVGSPADAYYGTVQVQAVMRSGKIAGIQFLQHPSDRSTSRYINDQAMPLLIQEAIQAQSANVDGVSGATFTSQAFRQSLALALAQAKK
ncbi:MAG: FMN-binding protein [Candidatus Kaiserbacteria bacterium]|nr:FMN-binding protein [Candidatus Kaiserbacteria bacterium]